MYSHGCQSPFMSCCLRMAPVMNLEASDSTTKGFIGSGIRRMGDLLNLAFSVSKDCWHSAVYLNVLFFHVSLFRGQASSVKWLMNHQ